MKIDMETQFRDVDRFFLVGEGDDSSVRGHRIGLTLDAILLLIMYISNILFSIVLIISYSLLT